MTPDRDDPIIEAGLDELLGGRTPPDLTARIMQAWAMQRGEATSRWPEVPLPMTVVATHVEPLPPPVQGIAAAVQASPNSASSNDELVMLRTRTSPMRERKSAWSSVGASAAVLLISAAVLGGVFVSLQQPKPVRPIAKSPEQTWPHQTSPDTTAPNSGSRNDRTVVQAPPALSRDNRIVKPAPPEVATTPSPSSPPVVATIDTPPPSDAADSIDSVESPESSTAELPLDDPEYAAASSDKEIVSFINTSLARTWKENDVKPAEPATDAEWCRRLYLRVVGRIPSVEEARHFLESKAADKRETLITELLTSKEYTEQYARNWSTIWSNILIGRTGGSEGLASREGLQDYLAHSLQENKPYNRIVYELLTATGSSQPGEPDFNGAVNFLLAGMKDDAALATGRTTRVFLGQQAQCAQCHQHPSADWSQGQFWAMNSFFRQMKAERTPDAVRLVNVDFVSASGDVDEAQVYYQLPTGELKAAFPKLPDGTEISPDGRLAEVNRREELAKWVAKSDELPHAYVNRIWSHFFGFGFTKPVDDMGAHNQAVHPEVLDRLATEFAASGYDMKKVIRWISLSDAFARSSKIPPGQLASADMPELGTVPLFSHYYARQMQVEEVYDSLQIAAKLRSTASSTPDLQQAKLDWLSQFNRPMGTDEGSEESHFDGSIGQSIIMLNGDLMQRAVSSEHEGLLNGVIRSNMKVSEKLEHLFLAALSRKPTKRELDAALTIVSDAGAGKEAQAIQDVWWALLNSNEFILDH